MPREAPLVAAALAKGIRVIGELELGWRLLPNAFIGLTGSNGKTTTVELIGHIHRTAERPRRGGGERRHCADLARRHARPANAVVVCEASSFQLEDTEAFAPEAAVLLNLQEDHLDRHGTFEAYRQAKLNVFAHQPRRHAGGRARGPPARGRRRRGDAGHVRRPEATSPTSTAP